MRHQPSAQAFVLPILWTLLATISVVAPFAAATALCELDENFDAYPAATSLHGLGGWKGVDNDPFFTAFTTTFPDPALSPPQSADTQADSDLVHEASCAGEGLVVFSAWQYIETPHIGTTGAEFLLLNTYSDGGARSTSASIRFDPSDGMAKILHGDGSNTILVPYAEDRWAKIQQVVDLDNDWTRIYYDDELISEYSWTGGILGGGGGALDIAAVELRANGSSSIYYDDLSLFPIPRFAEDFESYANGSDLHGQGGWKGFDNNPAAGAPATPDQANSATQSVEIAGASNLVHEFETPLDGVYSFSAWEYIPSDFISGGGFESEAGSLLRIFDAYSDGGAKHVAVELRADSVSGNVEVFQGSGTTTSDVPYVTDRWARIQVIVDLDDDWTQIYYDEDLITEYTWTGGITGSGGGVLDIAGVDLYGNGASRVFYDDLLLERGCGVGRTSDVDGDGRSLAEELVAGTDSCVADPVVPTMPARTLLVAALLLLSIGAAWSSGARVRA